MRERLTGGRATATVLFTDLVGSTELRARLGDEASEDVRRTHDRLLTQAIHSHAGHVVKGLGDGLMATFAAAADAVAAAVDIQQTIDRLNRSGKVPQPLAVRVGLSVGDVTIEADDVHGIPVIEASRLCALARGGETLAADVVRVLGGSAGGHTYTPLGRLELKGLPDGVAAVRIEWEPADVSAVPLPSLLTDVGRVFVGRDAQLERLEQLWKQASAAERQVAFLAGEPGVGKTRLAAELAASVHDQGGAVVAGRCDEDLGVPYQPFVEALRHFIDHTPPTALPGCLGRYGGELRRLVPELESVSVLPAPLTSDPETERYRLFDAVAGWLAAASADEPLLVVLDDLQWAAKPTLLLLRHVARAPDVNRVLLLGTYRDSELGHEHPLVEVLSDLRRESAVERISLIGLDSSGVTAFLEQAAGHTLGDEELMLARAIHEETEGNPFFVREVLRHLVETGGVEHREGRWVPGVPVEDVGIPQSIREVVGRRLARLSPPTNEVLRVAAVMGVEFEARTLLAAGAFDEDVIISSLEEAGMARVILEGSTAGRYRFAHALVRESLYRELSGIRRGAMHRRVAEAIEELHAAALDDHLPALTHHWSRATVPADKGAKAIEYARRAGERALSQFANDEAVAYFRQALEFLGASEGPSDQRVRLELMISLGEAERRAGDPAHRQRLLDAARLAESQGDAEGLARAVLANSRGAFSSAGRVDTDKIEYIGRALDALGDQHDELRARLLAMLAVELTWAEDLEERMRVSQEALALARGVGEPNVLSTVLHHRASAIWHVSTVHERLELATEALSLAEKSTDPVVATWWSRYRRAGPRLELGQVEQAGIDAAAAVRAADDCGQPYVRMIGRLMRANWLVALGRFNEAEQLSKEGFAIGERAEPDAPLFHTIQMCQIRWEQGRVDHRLVAEQEAICRDIPHVLLVRLLPALLRLGLGEVEEARAVLDACAAADFVNLPADNAWSPTMAVAALLCAALGDESRAAVLHDLIAPYADLFSAHALLWLGSFQHHLATLDVVLGRLDDASDRFAVADAKHEAVGALGWLARTRLEWGRTLLARRKAGDGARADELLRQALATARQLGMATVERQARELLR